MNSMIFFRMNCAVIVICFISCVAGINGYTIHKEDISSKSRGTVLLIFLLIFWWIENMFVYLPANNKPTIIIWQDKIERKV